MADEKSASHFMSLKKSTTVSLWQPKADNSFFMTAMKSASHLTVAKKVNISLFIASEKVKIIRWQRS